MARPPGSFGKKNAPPPVLHAPKGLAGGAPTPRPGRKMSLTVGLVSVGAAALAGGAFFESARARRAEECRAQAAQRGLPPDNCPTVRSGSHSSGGHGWYWSSGSSHSSSTSTAAAHSGSTSGGHASFGGFGHAGASHGGGHGGGA